MSKRLKKTPAISLVVEVKNWTDGREVFRQFLEAHPELGLRYSENTYLNFTRIHGPSLVDLDVMRKPSLRSPYIADVTRFDAAAYERISKTGYSETTSP